MQINYLHHQLLIQYVEALCLDIDYLERIHLGSIVNNATKVQTHFNRVVDVKLLSQVENGKFESQMSVEWYLESIITW